MRLETWWNGTYGHAWCSMWCGICHAILAYSQLVAVDRVLAVAS